MLICLIRTVILYFLLIAVIRLMGKRQLGEMGPLEFVVAILIADLASVPMQDLAIPLLSGIIPILIILAAELLLSVVCYQIPGLRRIFSGKPVILMEDGTAAAKELEKDAHHARRAYGALAREECGGLDHGKICHFGNQRSDQRLTLSRVRAAHRQGLDSDRCAALLSGYHYLQRKAAAQKSAHRRSK